MKDYGDVDNDYGEDDVDKHEDLSYPVRSMASSSPGFQNPNRAVMLLTVTIRLNQSFVTTDKISYSMSRITRSMHMGCAITCRNVIKATLADPKLAKEDELCPEYSASFH